MTHCTTSLPAIFIVAAAAAVVPLCSCWVYQKLSCWVGSQAAHTCSPHMKVSCLTCLSHTAHLDHPEWENPHGWQ